MLDFIIEVVGEIVGGILEFIVDGVSAKTACQAGKSSE